MSRHSAIFRAVSRLRAPVLALLALLAPCPAAAGVIAVDAATYSLDGGPAVTGAWELAERLAVAGDAAVVVMGKEANPSSVQTLLQMLETLNIPTLLTKKPDYEALIARGVVKPQAASGTAP